MANNNEVRTTNNGPKSKQELVFDEQLFSRILWEVKGFEKEVFVHIIISKLRQNHRLSNLWFALGLLLYEIERYECAIEAFNFVVRLNPNHKKLWNAKAIALSKVGRVNEATKCYQKALECYGGKRKGYKNIHELVRELEENKARLGLDNMEYEDIEFLMTTILDLESFVTEMFDANSEGEDELDRLISKLRLIEDKIEA